MSDEIDDNKVLLQSWVLKKSHKTHQWKKRWAVLRKCQFSYYKSSNEHKPRAVINISNLLSYASIPGSHKYHFTIYTSKKNYHFRVETQALFDQWMEALKSIVCPVSEDESSGIDTEIPNDLSGISKADSKEYLIEEGEVLLLRKYNQWKKIYLIVTNKNLYVCKTRDKTERPEKAIPISHFLDVVEVDAHKGKDWCLMIIQHKKTHYLSASSEQEMTKFLLAIKAVILQHRGKRQEEIESLDDVQKNDHEI